MTDDMGDGIEQRPRQAVALGCHAVVHPQPFLPSFNQSRAAQVRQVTRHERLRQTQAFVNVTDADFPSGQQSEDANPRRIGECLEELIERLGLATLLKRYPEQLSGGQQQRVAIGRALATKPMLLLADEPTGNLDEDTADGVLAMARDLVARTGCGFLMVTHSTRLAATLDRQVTLHAGRVT